MALSHGLLAPIGRIGNGLTDKAGPARQSEDGSLAGGCTSSMQMALKLKLALLAFATLRADAAGHGIWQRHRHHHQFGHPLELLLTTIRVVYSGGLAPGFCLHGASQHAANWGIEGSGSSNAPFALP